MSSLRVVVIGGHGKVALKFAQKATASKKYLVESVIRDAGQSADIEGVGAKPVVLSLEDSSVNKLADAFSGAHAVVFAAGAGGKGGEARTKAVDYEGAVKVFDAIEATKPSPPRLILVGAIDSRDRSKPAPSHYTQEDLERSEKSHGAIGTYYEYKRKADVELSKRTKFDWTILRPSGLSDEAGTGKINAGHISVVPTIPREDVASSILAILNNPELKGAAVDITGGSTTIAEALKDAFSKREFARIE